MRWGKEGGLAYLSLGERVEGRKGHEKRRLVKVAYTRIELWIGELLLRSVLYITTNYFASCNRTTNVVRLFAGCRCYFISPQ